MSDQNSMVTHDQLMEQIENFRAFLYFHGYQPPRRLKIRGNTVFDITGEFEMSGGYNERVWDRCYHPMTVPIAQENLDAPDAIITNRLVMGHLFGVTRDWIKQKHPYSWQDVRLALKEMAIPFVDPYLHQILPLLPDQAQGLMMDIGIIAWERDMEVKLRNQKGEPVRGFGMWPAELGINHRTVEIMVQKGVRFLVLDQAQIKADEFAPIYEVKTKNGPMYVLAYNGKEFAQKLAFSQIIDAKVFASKVKAYTKKVGVPPFAAMDMETFGEWRGMDSMYFLNYLVHKGLDPEDFKRYRNQIKPAKIIDASSWSCDCELGRWSGEHSCCGENEDLMTLKRDLYLQLREKLDQQLHFLNQDDPEWEQSFINFFLNTREKLGVGDEIDFSALSDSRKKPFERLYVLLVGLTSCGWFYTDSELERNIPKQCLQYVNSMD